MESDGHALRGTKASAVGLSQDQQRAAVVTAARTWLGTPYHHAGRVKGAGVDCAMLLAETYAEAGVIAPVEIAPYSPQWHQHRSAELYLAYVLERAQEIEGPPRPGDVALWKFGNCFSHGAIVMDWPMIVHAFLHRPVTLDNAETAQWLHRTAEKAGDRQGLRPRKFFSLWPLRSAVGS